MTLACSRNGYVCNPSLHQSYTVAEVAGLLGRIRSAALFAQSGFGADPLSADIFSCVSQIPSMRRSFCVRPVAEAGAEPVRTLGLVEKGTPPEPCTDPDKVVLRFDFALAADDLLRHLGVCGLSRYDMPEYYRKLDALPLTASGKILKRALVEQVGSGQLQPTAVRWREPSHSKEFPGTS